MNALLLFHRTKARLGNQAGLYGAAAAAETLLKKMIPAARDHFCITIILPGYGTIRPCGGNEVLDFIGLQHLPELGMRGSSLRSERVTRMLTYGFVESAPEAAHQWKA